MPEHDIEIKLPPKALKNVDVRIVVRSDKKKLGELWISKGSLDWRAARKQHPRSFTWEEIARRLGDEAD